MIWDVGINTNFHTLSADGKVMTSKGGDGCSLKEMNDFSCMKGTSGSSTTLCEEGKDDPNTLSIT